MNKISSITFGKSIKLINKTFFVARYCCYLKSVHVHFIVLVEALPLSLSYDKLLCSVLSVPFTTIRQMALLSHSWLTSTFMQVMQQ
jgi:hypothetical protein